MMRCLSRTLGLQLPFPVIIIDTKPSLFVTPNNPQLLISMQFSGYSFQLLYKDPLLLAYATSLHCCSTASQMQKPFGEALFCLHNPLPQLLCVVLNGHCFFHPEAAALVKKHCLGCKAEESQHKATVCASKISNSAEPCLGGYTGATGCSNKGTNHELSSL